MIEIFPAIEKKQVALSRADFNTGIVLDEDLKYATSSIQRIYTVLANFDEALRYANDIVVKNNNVECYIYDNENKFLKLITKDNI
jgi:hypothetical protein